MEALVNVLFNLAIAGGLLGLWVTIDLDYPRRGLLQLSDAPLEALRFEAVPER
jgi:hypothetical protein